jgi:hypothetical protein
MAATAAISLLAGCGIDDNYTGLGKGALPGDPLNPTVQKVECTNCTGGGGGGGQDIVLPSGDTSISVEDLTGKAYRFTALELSAPFKGETGGLLNGFFADAFKDNTLHILVQVVADDREAGTLELKVGPGEIDGDGYKFAGETSLVECTLAGATFETVVPGLLQFPHEAFTPPFLPVSFLKLSGVLSDDGSSIKPGILDGALMQSDAETIKIMGVAVKALLDMDGATPDLDTDDDGTKDAYRFVGVFDAVEVTIQ